MAIDTQKMTLEKRTLIDKRANELTSGVNIGKLNLSKYKGGDYFAVIADANGTLLTEEDEETGTKISIKVASNSNWHNASAIKARLASTPNAAKFMAWYWDGAKYVPARTQYVSSSSLEYKGNKGTIDLFVEQFDSKPAKVVSSIPGVAPLEFLKTKSAELVKTAKEHKSETDKSPKGLAKDAPRIVTRYWAVFMKEAPGLDIAGVKRILAEEYPELFNK